MKKLFVLLLISTLLLAMPSCTAVPQDPLAYQKGELSAELVFEKNGTRVSALIKLGPMTDSPRDAEIVFTSPEGLKVVRKNGNSTATFGGASVLSDPKLFMLCELFSLDGSIISAKTDRGATQITLSCGESTYDIYLSSDGRPRKITGEDFSLEIVWIEMTERHTDDRCAAYPYS